MSTVDIFIIIVIIIIIIIIIIITIIIIIIIFQLGFRFHNYQQYPQFLFSSVQFRLVLDAGFAKPLYPDLRKHLPIQ